MAPGQPNALAGAGSGGSDWGGLLSSPEHYLIAALPSTFFPPFLLLALLFFLPPINPSRHTPRALSALCPIVLLIFSGKFCCTAIERPIAFFCAHCSSPRGNVHTPKKKLKEKKKKERENEKQNRQNKKQEAPFPPIPDCWSWPGRTHRRSCHLEGFLRAPSDTLSRLDRARAPLNQITAPRLTRPAVFQQRPGWFGKQNISFPLLPTISANCWLSVAVWCPCQPRAAESRIVPVPGFPLPPENCY